ncbi:MAG TPA: hypothetical protein VK841_24405 [Polyangiaceae bacterium]|jgi:hypothetical protein|nr:hypothetical protein [Polyangiaceae bacterium]
MDYASTSQRMIYQEALALETRLDRLTSFAVRIPMVPAAAVSNEAQDAIERFLDVGKRDLRGRVREYKRWLEGPGAAAAPEEMQHRFTMVRLGFNVILEQFEIFSSALSQRAEHGTGVWLAGLDALALDALTLQGDFYEAPPVICYLDRGIGAAIRRARTRLPGGAPNPVAIIRVPRERMVGSGIGASLIHEVGHQGAALLDLLPSLREAIRRAAPAGDAGAVWALWERWISEIVADFWSVATLGIGASLGLMSVVSLPRYFVFRTVPDDPHPTPWIRMKLSCAMGRALFPDPQWGQLARIWEELYPTSWLSSQRREEIAALESEIPRFVSLLIEHATHRTQGRSLAAALPTAKRHPQQLRAYQKAWRRDPAQLTNARPSLVFAVFGQARADGTVTPEEESGRLAGLLTEWALRTALETSANCVAPLKRWVAAVA